MSKGEIKTARNILASNGRISGTRSGMLRALSFNGTWAEFESAFGEHMQADPEHPQIVILTDPTWQESRANSSRLQLDPKKYAETAVSFVLGEPSQETIARFSGEYGEHREIIGQLGSHICESICRIYYPQESGKITIYHAERSLLYQASAGTFTIFGE